MPSAQHYRRPAPPVCHAAPGRLPRRTLPPLARLIDTYARVLAACGDGLAAGWCVRATRVAQLAFAEFGITVSPLITRLRLHNAFALQLEGRWAGPVPASQNPATGLCGHKEPDDATLGADGWYGHLVPIVAGRYVVDATVSQIRVPHAGLHTPRVLVANVAATLARGSAHHMLHRAAGTVTELTYEPRTPDPGIEQLPGWESAPGGPNREMAHLIVEAMHRRLVR